MKSHTELRKEEFQRNPTLEKVTGNTEIADVI